LNLGQNAVAVVLLLAGTSTRADRAQVPCGNH
jgi:hypothetical protein